MLNNIDSRLNVSLKKQRLYEKQTKKAESILERQFGGSAYRCIIGSIEKKWSLSESLPIFQRKFRTQIQAERVIIQTMAQNIRKAREEQCLTQEDLAKKQGLQGQILSVLSGVVTCQLY